MISFVALPSEAVCVGDAESEAVRDAVSSSVGESVRSGVSENVREVDASGERLYFVVFDNVSVMESDKLNVPIVRELFVDTETDPSCENDEVLVGDACCENENEAESSSVSDPEGELDLDLDCSLENVNVSVEESSSVGVPDFVNVSSSVVDRESECSSVSEMVVDREVDSSTVRVVVTLQLDDSDFDFGEVRDKEPVTDPVTVSSLVIELDTSRVKVKSDTVKVEERLEVGSREGDTERESVNSNEGESVSPSVKVLVILGCMVAFERLAVNVPVGSLVSEKVLVVETVSDSTVRVSWSVSVLVPLSDSSSVTVTVRVSEISFVRVTLPEVELEVVSIPDPVYVHSDESEIVFSSEGDAVGSGLSEIVPEDDTDADAVCSFVSV